MLVYTNAQNIPKPQKSSWYHLYYWSQYKADRRVMFRKAGIDFYKAFKFCPRAQLSYWPSTNLVFITDRLSLRWTILSKNTFDRLYILLSKSGNTVWHSCRNWDYSKFLIPCIAWTWIFYYCEIQNVISHASFKLVCFLL